MLSRKFFSHQKLNNLRNFNKNNQNITYYAFKNRIYAKKKIVKLKIQKYAVHVKKGQNMQKYAK